MNIVKITTKTTSCRIYDVGGSVPFIACFVFCTWKGLTLSQSLNMQLYFIFRYIFISIYSDTNLDVCKILAAYFRLDSSYVELNTTGLSVLPDTMSSSIRHRILQHLIFVSFKHFPSNGYFLISKSSNFLEN